MNWINASLCVFLFFCFFCFLLCVSYPTTHELNAVACVHACKSGPFGCTPKPRRHADTVRTYTTQQLHDTDNTTCKPHCEQHDLALSLTLTTKTFVEFPKFNWSYDLLRYMPRNSFHTFYQTEIHTYRHQTDSVTPYRGHRVTSTSKQALRAAC